MISSTYVSSSGLTSRVLAAQNAYEDNNPHASVAAHILKNEPGHNHHALSFLDSRAIQLGKPCAFYGSLGVVASMCSITLLYPLHISVYQTLLISLGFLCSLSLWSALSEFNLKKLEYDVYTWERKREEWECDNFIEGERKEMIEIYQNKGLSREDAEKVIRTLSSNTELFVDLMMVEELGIMPIHNRVSSQVFGIVAGLSLFVFGGIPCLVFLLSASQTLINPISYVISSSLCVITVLAYINSFFYGTRWWLSSCLTNIAFSLASVCVAGLFTLLYP